MLRMGLGRHGEDSGLAETTLGARVTWGLSFLLAILLLLLPKLPYPQFFAYPLAPHLAMMLVFCWGLDTQGPAGGLSVFFLGMIESQLSGSPLGLWSLGLSAFYLATMLLRRQISLGRIRAWQGFALLSLMLMVCLWWLGGLIQGAFMPLFGVLLSWVSTCMIFPIFVVAIAWLQRYVYLGVGVG